MIELDELTYTAIITLNLPGMDDSTSVAVTLAPHEVIKTAGGRVKPLRDCTLADLQEFADSLEAGVWDAYKEIKLVELAGDEEAQVKVTILNETGGPLPSAEAWLDHAIVLSQVGQGNQEKSQIPNPKSQEGGTQGNLPSQGQGQELSGTQEATVPETTSNVEPVEEIPVVEAPPNPPTPAVSSTPIQNPKSKIQNDVESAVAVAEPELVRPEREAPTHAPVTPPSHPQIRIIGRRRAIGHPTWTAVDILINEPAYRDAQAHALTSLDREVAGFLIGPQPEKQPDGRYVVHISDTIIAKHTRMHGASVTYTPESWRYINDKLAELYPDETAIIVGWYHTHTSFGIFLSGMDQFIHQNFFIQLWHVALVLDPVARKSGFFCWDRHKSRVDPYDFPWPDWMHGSW
jgi:proteasome lid subunit RPN8/RPN11